MLLVYIGQSGQLGQAWEHKWMQSPITIKWVCARMSRGRKCEHDGRASKLEGTLIQAAPALSSSNQYPLLYQYIISSTSSLHWELVGCHVSLLFALWPVAQKLSCLLMKDVLHPHLSLCAAVSTAFASKIHHDVSKASVSSKPPLKRQLKPQFSCCETFDISPQISSLDS